VATGVFLFSDIEGSTRLFASEPDRMRAALQRHDVLLGQVVVDGGGTVFIHTGDGLACWFPSSEGGMVEVDVGPAQRQELTSASTGSCRQVQVGEELDVVLAHDIEQAPDLLDRRRSDVRRLDPWG